MIVPGPQCRATHPPNCQLTSSRKLVASRQKLCCGTRTRVRGRPGRWYVLATVEPGEVASVAPERDLRATIAHAQHGLPWTIRVASRKEATRIADLMARGFHRQPQLKVMRAASFRVFKAEVLNSMISKLHYCAEDGFVCLVSEDGAGELCGAVEVSRQDQPALLQSLASLGVDVRTYAYITGMVVDQAQRRKGLGTALLEAAEVVAEFWGERETMLHVYVDNPSAIEFYEANGYVEVCRDADWFRVIGRRKRSLMRKE